MLYARFLDFFFQVTSSDVREERLSFLFARSDVAPKKQTVLCHGHFFQKQLSALGLIVKKFQGTPQPSCQIIIGRKTHPTVAETLLAWKQAVEPGGVILLCMPRWELAPWELCAEFLRSGLLDPMQEITRTLILTSGVVPQNISK